MKILFFLFLSGMMTLSEAHIGTLNSKLQGELEIIASTEFDHVEECIKGMKLRNKTTGEEFCEVKAEFHEQYERNNEKWDMLSCPREPMTWPTGPKPPPPPRTTTTMRPFTTSSPDTDCNCGKANTGGLDSERIIGGTEAGEHEFPWVVRININKASLSSCGGSIISSRHVLTAGHCIVVTSKIQNTEVKTKSCQSKLTQCVEDNPPICSCYSNIKVLAGLHDKTKGPQKTFDVTDVFLHEEYQESPIWLPDREGAINPIYDFAILTLKDTIEFTQKISPVCLPQSSGSKVSKYEDKEATVAGWGWTTG